MVSVVAVGSWSWRQRSPEMKFPADPEPRRVVTGRVMWAAVSWALVVSGFILIGDGFI